MENVKVKFKKLSKEAKTPSYAHDGDVGMDLTAVAVEYDVDNDVYVYHTGLAVETEKGYGILLFARSSNRKTDAYLTNHVGVVDSATYRGEIMLCFKNRFPTEQMYRVELRNITDKEERSKKLKEFMVRHRPYNVGDRVAQMVVMPHPIVEVEEVSELTSTERGEGGFGSTGK